MIEGTRNDDRKKRTGGSGFSALVDKRMVHASELDKASKTLLVNIEESKRQMQKDLADADVAIGNPQDVEQFVKNCMEQLGVQMTATKGTACYNRIYAVTYFIITVPAHVVTPIAVTVQ